MQHNLVPACVECQKSKAAEEVFSWFTRQDFYSLDRHANLILWVNQKQFLSSEALFELATAGDG